MRPLSLYSNVGNIPVFHVWNSLLFPFIHQTYPQCLRMESQSAARGSGEMRPLDESSPVHLLPATQYSVALPHYTC